MHIKVRLYANLRGNHAPEEEVEIPEGATVAFLMEILGVPESTVTLIFINGHHASSETELHEGDGVALFPPIGGG
jgi:molybdopterin converting factor small subunit